MTDRLDTYRAKRDFSRTPEPAGAPAAGTDGKRFVVQRHRARRLHYDLRLEMDGVLASWAVPKGPTLDPKARRAAFHVEDHPIEYIDFEGIIPRGEYGGGDVIVWDEGTFVPHDAGEPPDPAKAVHDGELHFDLRGQKLAGRFVLVRTRTDASGRETWLLLHKNDQDAVPGWDPEEHPRSVLSGRTNDEVKADPDRMWRSDLPPAQASVPLKAPVAGGPSDDELARLDALGAAGTWSVFGRELRLTNLDKVLFPGRGRERPVTKREFIRYSARIAPVLVPYLRGRALTMHRFPDGAGGTGFWHKHLPRHVPAWVPRWVSTEAGAARTATYLVVDEPGALVWAANFGALEWQAWTSLVGAPGRPTYVLIDLDPGEKTTWDDLLTLARLHRSALDHLGVRGQPKLSGHRGLEIWIPIAPGPTFEETRAWAEQLSRAVGAVVPDLVSRRWQVSDHSGLARLDYRQNAITKTLVAPYSPRAAAGAPVSAPIDWDELDDPSVRPDGFSIRTVLDRLAEKGDVFQSVLERDQRLPEFS